MLFFFLFFLSKIFGGSVVGLSSLLTCCHFSPTGLISVSATCGHAPTQSQNIWWGYMWAHKIFSMQISTILLCISNRQRGMKDILICYLFFSTSYYQMKKLLLVTDHTLLFTISCWFYINFHLNSESVFVRECEKYT